MGITQKHNEKSMHVLFFLIAFASVAILFMITLFLFVEGIPIFEKVSIREFLFGKYWYPTSDPADFGIFPLIVGSVSVTILSAIISIPLGVMTAIYLAEIASAKFREIVKPVVELLASLPSVVIGFFGMVVVARCTATLRSARRFSHSAGSIAATVRRPRGGKADFLRTKGSAYLKLQNVSGSSG